MRAEQSLGAEMPRHDRAEHCADEQRQCLEQIGLRTCQAAGERIERRHLPIARPDIPFGAILPGAEMAGEPDLDEREYQCRSQQGKFDRHQAGLPILGVLVWQYTLDDRFCNADLISMLNLLSLLIGLLSIFPILFALTPFIGFLNWVILPLPVLGFLIGSVSSGRAGRNLNLALIVVAILRLILGHGLL
jgi:hypothetical protein